MYKYGWCVCPWNTCARDYFSLLKTGLFRLDLSFFRYYSIKKQHKLCNNTVVLCYLTRQAHLIFVLKHIPLIYIYMCGCTYVICTLIFSYFCVSSVFNPIPNFTKQKSLGYLIISCIILKIELLSALNSFAGAVKTQKLTRVSFLFELVAVVS